MPNLLGQDYPMATLGVGSGAKPIRLNDSAISGGLAFLTGELEKLDPKLREPLTSVTWPRDIVPRTGGGWVESTSAFNVSYATPAGDTGGIISGETNTIPMMQADIDKDSYRVFSFAHGLKVPFVDLQKLNNMGRNLEEILDRGIRLHYDKTLDLNVYQGFSKLGTYGLINNPNVTTVSASVGASGSTEWDKKTPDEILDDVNQLINATWAASEYDLSGMANHILVPPAKYTMLVSRKVSEAGNMSILQYLLDNNIGRDQGIDVVIRPSRFCTGAGTNGKDRMVGYANDEDRVRFDITVSLSRVMTQPSVDHFAYITLYASQFGEVQFLYLQPFQYTDGI